VQGLELGSITTWSLSICLLIAVFKVREKEAGVALIEMEGGTTRFGYFQKTEIIRSYQSGNSPLEVCH